MSDTHCPKHRVRWFDASPVATKPDHRCILCEIDRADAACEERDRYKADSEALDYLIKFIKEHEENGLIVPEFITGNFDCPEQLRKRLEGKK